MKPHELIEILMQDAPLSENQLDEFLQAQKDKNGELEEGLQYDVKDWKLSFQSGKEEKETKFEIRKFVTSFANSEGGVLIVGVENKTGRITGCREKIGGQPTHEWALRLFNGLAVYFSPMPRSRILHHPHGDVLLIATESAPIHVPIIKNGKMAYFLRIGESTVEAPDYLISDLMLGRRRRPILEPKVAMCTVSPGKIDFKFRIDNIGLVPAHKVKMRLVYYSLLPSSAINKTLIAYIDVMPLPPAKRCVYELGLRDQGANMLQDIEPFGHYMTSEVSLHIPIKDDEEGQWSAAILLATKMGYVSWYEFKFSARLLEKGLPKDIIFDAQKKLEENVVENCTIQKTQSRRPSVTHPDWIVLK